MNPISKIYFNLPYFRNGDNELILVLKKRKKKLLLSVNKFELGPFY